MFNEVVIGIDRDGRARELIGPARAVAPNATFRLVHVRGAAGKAGDDAEAPHALLARAKQESGLHAAALDLRADLTPAQGLARAAAEADLLVIGAPSRLASAAGVSGDVAREIFHRAPGPVLFVPPGCRDLGDRPHSLGLAFDGSAESQRALDVGMSIARETGAEVEICRAIDSSGSPAWERSTLDEYASALLASEERRLSELAAECDVPCHSQVRDGPTADVLANLARRCDILICGSHGWGPSARAAFGSTAEALFGRLRTPLLVVPPVMSGHSGNADEARPEGPLSTRQV